MHYTSLVASTLQVVSHSRHQRSSAVTDIRGVTSRAGQSRTPSPPATLSSYSSSSRDLAGDSNHLQYDPFAARSRTTTGSVRTNTTRSSSTRSGSLKMDRYDDDQSYLSFDDDSDTDYDELDELSDWSYVQVNGRPFPLPRMSMALPLDKSFDHPPSYASLFSSNTNVSQIASPPHQRSHPLDTAPSTSDSRVMRELSVKEIEPIMPLMEPAIFADDGAHGDWRQMVDIFIRDDQLDF